jgi:uncharacterized protein (TIGR02452 family)
MSAGKDVLKAIAHQTLQIIADGKYQGPAGEVEVGSSIRNCVEATRCYSPSQLDRLRSSMKPERPATTISFSCRSTLEAARELTASHPRVAALNFASARNPGGGFLNGACAQEESLARASGLYASLLHGGKEYYEAHNGDWDSARRDWPPAYSDHMIYSPRCPVFRNDDGDLMPEPYLVDFITSAAPNAGRMGREKEGLGAILGQRAAKILALGANEGATAIILGAWGCGVFRNDVGQVARTFAELLADEFKGAFDHVEFAIIDGKTHDSFVQAYEAYGDHGSTP